MTKIKKNPLGFTLIELLVVIAIIGILAALGFFGFSTAQKKARDAQRKNDLKEVKQALEAYAGAHTGFYPCSATTATCPLGDGNSQDTGGNTGIFATTGPLAAYLPNPSKIDDPIGSSTTYFYQYNGNTTTGDAYVLSATLEAEGTNKWWVVCSNGMTGIHTATARPSSATCPL